MSFLKPKERYHATAIGVTMSSPYHRLLVRGQGVLLLRGARPTNSSWHAPWAFIPPGTFGGAKDSLPDGRDRNAGTGVPWDDGGCVLRQYGEDTKLDLKNSSWQQRISDSDLPTGGFSWS